MRITMSNDPTWVSDLEDNMRAAFAAGRVFEAMDRGDADVCRDVPPDAVVMIMRAAEAAGYEVSTAELEEGLFTVKVVKRDCQHIPSRPRGRGDRLPPHGSGGVVWPGAR